MLRPVIPDQRSGDHFFACPYAFMAKLGQRYRIPFTGEDGVYNRQPGQAGDVADDVMQLQIHLIQSLLHVIDVRGGHLHEALAMPEQ